MFCEDMEELNYMERVFVDQTWIDRGDTYNLVIGGGSVLGLKHTTESRHKMSVANTGKTIPNDVRQKISKTLSGRRPYTITEEIRQNMSLAHKGKKLKSA